MKAIESHPGYYAKKDGTILRGNTPLPVSEDYTGRLRVSIGGKFYYVHQLIAKTFCPNPNGKKWVRFLDGNVKNVCASNLFYKGDRNVLDIQTNIIYMNIEAAAKKLYLNESCVRRHCNGKRVNQLFRYYP